jgi:RNase P subunit RPR2
MALFKRLVVVVGRPPEGSRVVAAPPAVHIVPASTYHLCGSCATLLAIAEPGELQELVILCRECGTHNRLDRADARGS